MNYLHLLIHLWVMPLLHHFQLLLPLLPTLLSFHLNLCSALKWFLPIHLSHPLLSPIHRWNLPLYRLKRHEFLVQECFECLRNRFLNCEMQSRFSFGRCLPHLLFIFMKAHQEQNNLLSSRMNDLEKKHVEVIEAKDLEIIRLKVWVLLASSFMVMNLFRMKWNISQMLRYKLQTKRVPMLLI